MIQKGETILSWQAFEFKDRELKTDWFWAIGIIALAGSVTAFIYANFLFGIFIILSTASIFYFATVKARLITYEITSGGVVYEGMFYPFETLHAFWLEEHVETDRKLLLKSERFFVPILTLPYDDAETGDLIHEALSDIIPEEPLQEPYGQLIMERLGF